jgi:RNA polymerase sigma-70 factor (ECF subfamily)
MKIEGLPATQGNGLYPHEWVSRYADYLYAYAIARINDEDKAKDLVQDTFLAALEKINYFEGKSNERTWLTGILKHKIVDVYRKKSKLVFTGVEEAEREQQDYFDQADGHWLPAFAPQPFGIDQADVLVNKEFNQILKNCMKKLPPMWLSVFTMKHVDDEATEKICSELKVSAANFWVIIHRAKVNLRACLQKNWI